MSNGGLAVVVERHKSVGLEVMAVEVAVVLVALYKIMGVVPVMVDNGRGGCGGSGGGGRSVACKLSDDPPACASTKTTIDLPSRHALLSWSPYHPTRTNLAHDP